jgi:hypothetical protein
VSNWPQYAEAAGVMSDWREQIQRNFRRFAPAGN